MLKLFIFSVWVQFDLDTEHVAMGVIASTEKKARKALYRQVKGSNYYYHFGANDIGKVLYQVPVPEDEKERVVFY